MRSTVGESTGLMAGTSVAAAQVTGAISQVWAANPLLNYQQVLIGNKLSLYASCQVDLRRCIKEKLVFASLSIGERCNN